MPETFAADFFGFTLQQASWKRGGVLIAHDTIRFKDGAVSAVVEHAPASWDRGASLESTAMTWHVDGLLAALEQAGFRFVRLDDEASLPRLNAR